MQVQKILSITCALITLSGCAKTVQYRFGANHAVGQGGEISAILTQAATARCEKQGYTVDVVSVEKKVEELDKTERTEVLFQCIDPITHESVEVASEAKPSDESSLEQLAKEGETSEAPKLEENLHEMKRLLRLGDVASKQETIHSKGVIDAELPIYFNQD